MVAELAERLQKSLGSSYTIVRELGGGGMSRVFLAEDNALGRSVVFKVLSPELAAGVNAARFNREVQVSARLQHPHIVPVLTAGEVDGLPYYVMPFVKGESLRARLTAGPLAIPEVVSVLTDVARALGYAHAEGIVHRDIKPDNILLSAGACSVADFGIAKALDAARANQTAQHSEGAARTEALTTLGTSIGTPAYMAPEQVAGDPDVDHRADIYSLGCVAYEMLTGEAPFAGKSPQQMLAAHVLEKPVPLTTRRADIPASLVAAVDHCLAKQPADRPQSASELLTELQATTSHEALPIPPVRPTRATGGTRRTLAIAGGVLILGAAAALGYRTLRKPAPATDGSLAVAVAPFDVLDPQLALWKEGMVDVLSRNLDGAGPIRSISPSASVKRWEGRADRTAATAFGKRVGARLVVYGQLQPAGRELVDAKAWIVDTGRDALPIEVQVRDSLARMDRVTDSLSVRVLAAIGRNHAIGTARLSSLGSGSLPAIKAFLRGSQYFRRTQWDSAAASFREAVALDSTFGVAYMHLAQSTGWLRGYGDPESASANRKAGALVRPGLSAHDSLFLTAVGHYASAGSGAQANPAAARAAIATMQVATERYPDDPEAWYLLGDMRYHADRTLSDREALSYFDRAIAADSDFAPAYVHAIELAYRYGTEAGRRYADAYLQRDPRDVEGEGIRFAALASDPRTRPAQIAAVLDTLPPHVARKAFTAVSRLPDSAETAVRLIRRALDRAPSQQKSGLTGLLANQLALRGHTSEAWALALANNGYVAAEIAGLGLIPTDSALKVLRPFLAKRSDAFLMAIPAVAMAGDTATLLAQAAGMEQVARRDTTPMRAIMAHVAASLRAYSALAKGDTAAATRLFEALPDSLVAIPFDAFTRARLVGRQDPRRAIALLEQHTSTPDLLYAARELERARLAERIGDKERAVDAYSFVAAIWRNAEPGPLRDAVKEANEALQRLDSDGRLRAQMLGVSTKP